MFMTLIVGLKVVSRNIWQIWSFRDGEATRRRFCWEKLEKNKYSFEADKFHLKKHKRQSGHSESRGYWCNKIQ